MSDERVGPNIDGGCYCGRGGSWGHEAGCPEAVPSDIDGPVPHAWAQWARVTDKNGMVRRQELLTASLPFHPDATNGEVKVEMLGEPVALYTRDIDGPAGEADDLIERLKRRADTRNGTLVGASDGDTYTVGYYTIADCVLDREAASRLAAYQAKVGELEAKIAEREQQICNLIGVTEIPV